MSDPALPLLRCLLDGPAGPEELAQRLGRPLASVRRSLTFLAPRPHVRTRAAAVSWVGERGDQVALTPAGRERVEAVPGILRALAEGPLTQGEIAEVLRRELASVTATLSALARLGLVVGERVQKGVTRYRLTAAGVERVREVGA